VIHLYDALLGRLGIRDYRLELNSIGDADCRPAYVETLRAWLGEHDAELDEATREQAGRNPLRALDNIAAKPAEIQEVLRQAPTIGNALCAACRAHFEDVRRYLDAFGVRYDVVPTLVRGLDYYTRTTWEFVGPEGGSTSTLSGGGRYDGLAEELGGPDTPGVGFGAGVERLLLALEDAGNPAPREEGIDVFFVCEEGADRAALLAKMLELRAGGIRADADFAGRSPKGQRTQASRLGAKRVVVVGPDTDLAELAG
jgi:histidyl-tRNA synthetase